MSRKAAGERSPARDSCPCRGKSSPRCSRGAWSSQEPDGRMPTRQAILLGEQPSLPHRAAALHGANWRGRHVCSILPHTRQDGTQYSRQIRCRAKGGLHERIDGKPRTEANAPQEQRRIPWLPNEFSMVSRHLHRNSPAEWLGKPYWTGGHK